MILAHTQPKPHPLLAMPPLQALKHVSVQAQEAAYRAWMQLISNFALDHSESGYYC